MIESAQAVYDFIVRFKAEHNGAQPTIRAISEATGLAYSHVNYLINGILSKEGLVEVKYIGTNKVIIVKGGAWIPPISTSARHVDS